MKKIILIFTIICLLINMQCIFIKAENNSNIALDKPVESSGSINIDTEKDYNVTDGDYDTKWCAGKRNFNDTLYEWEKEGHFIIIDLLGTYEISKFAIFQASSGGKDRGVYAFNMLQYKVEVSLDKENWQNIKEEDSLSQEEEVIIREIPTVQARYFKLSSKRPDISNDFAMRIREIEIYENITACVTTPVSTSTNNPNIENSENPDIDNQELDDWSFIKIIVIIIIFVIVVSEMVILIILKKK